MKQMFFHPLPAILFLAAGILSTSSSEEVALEPFVAPEPVKTVAPSQVVRGPITPMKVNQAELALRPTPSADEVKTFAAFSFPLSASSRAATEKDGEALSAAVREWSERRNPNDHSILARFVDEHQDSPWAASIKVNLALGYYAGGYFSKALQTWKDIWESTAALKEPDGIETANLAAAEYALMLARVGRMDDLEALFKSIEGRAFQDGALVRLDQAREGLWGMKNHPEIAFRCGPYALSAVAEFKGKKPAAQFFADKSTLSTDKGFSLDALDALAKAKLDIRMEVARRSPGAAIVLPAVVHWRVGHYGALLREENGLYFLKDPTFGNNTWMTLDAIEAESSGLFLIPADKLPAGWEKVSKEEAASAFGKGYPTTSDPSETNPCSKGTCNGSDSAGMAVSNFHLMLGGLHIEDTPVGYSNGHGPDLKFRVHYNMKEDGTPTPRSHFSPQWECDWVSYLEFTPTSGVPASITAHLRGGGDEVHTGFDTLTQYYAKDNRWDTRLKRITDGVNVWYERWFPDGSREVYSQIIYGTTTRIFLTYVFEREFNPAQPSLNYVALEYDTALPSRLARLRDAAGKPTTLGYADASFPFLVTSITDPFGRSATFSYQMIGGVKRLVKITDVIGLESSFEYNASGQVSAMTTPYGRTTFSSGNPNASNGLIRWIESVDPNGDKERAEFYWHDIHIGATGAFPFPSFNEQAPSGPGLSFSVNYERTTFYWDKKAMYHAAGNFAKARMYRWLTTSDALEASGVLHSEKPAFENRIWYHYPGQTANSDAIGTSSQPSVVARVVEDGNGGTATAFSSMEYNAVGGLTRRIDEAGRETVFDYDGSGLDLLAVKQRNSTGGFDTLQSFTYDPAFPPHSPKTITDAAGQTTTFTYNAYGQPLTITNALNEITTLVYETNLAANGYGRLKKVTVPVAGAEINYTYDAYGRVRTETGLDGYTVTYDYDNFDRVTLITHPDGSTEQFVYDRLDLFASKDRDGHWTRTWHNALRQPILTADALGRTTQMRWCKCGGLWQLTDGNNNVTTWKHDEQSRVYEKSYADGKKEKYLYEPKSGRLSSVTDAKGQVRTMTYNLDGTLKQLTYTVPQGGVQTPPVSYDYDPYYPRVVSGPGGLRTYFPAGVPGALQPKSIETGVPSQGVGSGSTIGYSYDALGRVKTRWIGQPPLVAPTVTTWNYDALGRVNSVSNPLGTFSHTYVGNTGRLDHTDLPNGQVTGYEYFTNVQGGPRLKTLHHRMGTATVSKFDYTYSPGGTLKTWQRQLGAAATPTEFRFIHDAEDQITAATLVDAITPTNVLKQQSWQYDKAGNRTSAQSDATVGSATHNNRNQLTATSGGGKLFIQGHTDEPAKVKVTSGATTVDAATDAANNYTAWVPVSAGSNTLTVEAKDYAPAQNTRTKQWSVSVTGGAARTLSYDDNGNLLSDGTRAYEWDAENRLIKITQSGAVTEFVYDGLSRRVKEKLNGTVIRLFVWCGMELCEERDGSGAIVKRFYPEGEQWVTGANAGNYTYTRDHLGSIRELTDATTAVRARYDYDLWGARTKLSGDLDAMRGFTGHPQHWTGLLLAPFRAYDPDLGRWISEDPIGIDGGINVYGYVGNTILSTFDPSGLDKLFLIGPDQSTPLGELDSVPLTDMIKAAKDAGYKVTKSCVAQDIKNAVDNKDVTDIVFYSHGMPNGNMEYALQPQSAKADGTPIYPRREAPVTTLFDPEKMKGRNLSTIACHKDKSSDPYKSAYETAGANYQSLSPKPTGELNRNDAREALKTFFRK